MMITEEVREFAAKQNAGVKKFVAADEAEAGMAEMSRVYRANGEKLYLPTNG
jgi:phosphomethylpyrimidine synthase